MNDKTVWGSKGGIAENIIWLIFYWFNTEMLTIIYLFWDYVPFRSYTLHPPSTTRHNTEVLYQFYV